MSPATTPTPLCASKSPLTPVGTGAVVVVVVAFVVVKAVVVVVVRAVVVVETISGWVEVVVVVVEVGVVVVVVEIVSVEFVWVFVVRAFTVIDGALVVSSFVGTFTSFSTNRLPIFSLPISTSITPTTISQLTTSRTQTKPQTKARQRTRQTLLNSHQLLFSTWFSLCFASATEVLAWHTAPTRSISTASRYVDWSRRPFPT